MYLKNSYTLTWIMSACFAMGIAPGLRAEADRLPEVDIDATEMSRRLLMATWHIPLEESLSSEGGVLRLWYPKWVQGAHAPGGPVQNVAGIEIENGSKTSLAWRRTPGEVHQIQVTIPPETPEIEIRLRYICNQSSPNSHGLDSFGSESLGVISPNTVTLYPDGIRLDAWRVKVKLKLPDGWKFATSLLPVETGADASGATQFCPVTLEELIDSPILAGRHVSTYDLVEANVSAPPHRLHVFSEVETATRIHDEVLARLRRVVTQASGMFGSHPFPAFDVLVATTNVLARNGLEHRKSSLNVIPLGCLDHPEHLKDWDRMLIPHEYVHTWCGKYRRPQGMITPDAHTPYDTELLWVYEGLTQYLGELLEVRSGLATADQYRWMILQRLRWARLQQGRQWRPLSDTAAASHLLRAGSPAWGHLRRDQDYYHEGALLWLEADVFIRQATNGKRSLDDFCQAFFSSTDPNARSLGYEREDVINALHNVAPRDWDGWVRRHIEQPSARGPLSVAADLGYLVQFANRSPEGPQDARIDYLDARDSLGASFRADGTIESVLLETPADRAGLAPEMRVVGVGDFLWSRERFQEALESTPVVGELRLLVAANDRLVSRKIEYDGGPRYFTLIRDEKKPDVLARILEPK
jgi:predicted metalloprotease with PDZ domain